VSTTRLLILGVVKIFQPVHGYFVRRELLSWRVDQWAHVNPGSIYNGLRTLTRDGFLEEVEVEGGKDSRGRTSYRLTPDGDTEFFSLLHEALWSLDDYAPDRMLAALGFIPFLRRDEVIAAIEHRIAQIDASKMAVKFKDDLLRNDPSVPDHTSEILQLAAARLDGERGWAEHLLERLRAGAYVFEGEGPLHGATSPEAAPAP
jgi:DNA-binding PadR family transcriptional regulator